ncbi:MAG: hypothetical protein AABZ08_07850 [Planctomycetota bacterium]
MARINAFTTNPTAGILSCFQFVCNVDGNLRIVALGTDVRTSDMAALIACLMRPGVFDGLTEINLDLDGVSSIDGQCTLVLAQFMHLSRLCGGCLRITGIHEQVAAVLWVFRRNHELMSLVRRRTALSA